MTSTQVARSTLEGIVSQYRNNGFELDEIETQELADREVFNLYGYEEPFDRIRFFQVLLFTIDHPSREQPPYPTAAMWGIVTTLDFDDKATARSSNPTDRRAHRWTKYRWETFALWPKEDVEAVIAWLIAAETWDDTRWYFEKDFCLLKSKWNLLLKNR